MPVLNLGILAHVDTGKTSLTERLLHAAGVTDTLGRVDDGSTRTDSLELERRRGITIKSAVVSFALRGTTVNLIDTPGHPDFIAEVERVLGVLDGAVLVVSAVEGVQAQTRVLARTLHRLGIPTLVFVNKVDRGGARFAGVLDEIASRVSPAIVPMTRVVDIGTRQASVASHVDLVRLADHDDQVLAALVEERPPPPVRVRGRVHPVFFGSAITGAGIEELIGGITGLLPSRAAGAEASGTVFKVERGPAGEKLAYLRMFGGVVRVRDRVGPDRVTGIEVFADGGTATRDRIVAGEIGRLRGLATVKIGDAVGARAEAAAQFAPPSLETVVEAARPVDRSALHGALTELAEQDPLIALRQDEDRHELHVSLYGEVQKEVIEATLAEQYGIEVTFRETVTLCVERPAGVGEAVEVIGVEPNPFLATVGLRVEPGTGTFALGVEAGAMPAAFFKAVEETVHETLRRGLCGWPVDGYHVTLTRCGYWARQSHAHGVFDKSMSSTAGDFRQLTPLVVMAALRVAGTTVLAPVHAFRAELPADTLPAVLPLLARLGGFPLRTSGGELEGMVPAGHVHEFQRRLPGLTRGEGLLETAFDHYEPVRSQP